MAFPQTFADAIAQIKDLEAEAKTLWASHEVAVVAVGAFVLGVVVKWIF